jgi:MSHA biogenesis protein MshL
MKKISILLGAIILIIYGCATPKMTDVSETMALIEPPALDVTEQKPEPIQQEEFPQSIDTGRFSLSVRDADMRDILLLLSKDSGVNIIADSDVTGNISVDFTDLTLESALYAITRPLGYTFRMDRGFIRVSKPILETRTFRIDYITGKRTSSSTMNAAISGGGTAGGVTTPTSNINLNFTGATGAAQTTQGGSLSGQGNVQVTTSGTSDFWEEIQKGLEVIIFGDSQGATKSTGGVSRGDSSGKKLVINALAGIIMVTDYSDNMEFIEAFLNDIEMAVSKQVMIQAHIIEVTLNDDYQFGIDWELIMRSGMDSLTISQGLLIEPATEVFQIDFERPRYTEEISALLDVIEEQGQVNVLSSPKVSTMNNQKAVIKLTTREVSWVTSTFLNAEGNVLSSYTNPQIDEVGLFLDVTPQIDDDGMITMQIHPSISDKLRDSISPDGKSTKPVINVREADTMIKVKNGQTIVIAGLITDKLTESVRKVPIIGDIPLLGMLFRQTIQKKTKAELVILLTPYVLNDRSIEDIRKEHEERLKKAGRTFQQVPLYRKQPSVY